ncbi:MAG: argD [Bacteroidetes bacterium]|nr:argD [Bacteroidota bacterium]
METKKADKKYVARSSSGELEISRSDGSCIFDSEGKKYIDFVMGWCVGNLGWGNAEIEKAMREFNGPDYVLPGFIYKPWTELAELLAEMAPGNLSKSFRSTGGTESVETAMQLAMAYTGRKKFLSLEDSYHGNSIATLSIGASEEKDKLPNSLQNCHKIALPLDEKALKKVETQLKQKDVAAFIMEPVPCNLGVYIPKEAFMQGLQKLCRKYGTLLVIDEVATGFGRTGKLFACEHFGLEPDIICMGKALSGGYAGIGATITTEKIASAVKEDVSIYSTYGWHPRSVHAAICNLKYMKRHQKELMKNVQEMSALIISSILDMDFKTPVEIRAKGLAISVDVDDSDYAEKIKKSCKKKGLLISVQEKKLVFFPALNIKKEDVEAAMEILQKST